MGILHFHYVDMERSAGSTSTWISTQHHFIIIIKSGFSTTSFATSNTSLSCEQGVARQSSSQSRSDRTMLGLTQAEKKTRSSPAQTKSAMAPMSVVLMFLSILVPREGLHARRDTACKAYFVVFISSVFVVVAFLLEIMFTLYAEGFAQRKQALGLFRGGS